MTHLRQRMQEDLWLRKYSTTRFARFALAPG